MNKRVFFIVVLGVIMALLVLGGGNPAKGERIDQPVFLRGWLNLIWGDGPRDSGLSPVSIFLVGEDGQVTRLEMEPFLAISLDGILALNRQRVIVEGTWIRYPGEGQVGLLRVGSIQPEDGAMTTEPGHVDDIIGPQPWVSLLCKFADVPAEPNPPVYFQGMYADTYPGLDHYWREQSFDIANMQGSDATDVWHTLPQPRSYYVYDNQLDWGRAAEDCTAVADSEIYFPDFVGINLMFNDVLDCCAWGGGWYLCLDGVCQNWRMTWEPPWGYQNIGIIAHETGHGFGLPHSSGQYGQTYDNAWDVMSDVWSNCDRGAIDPDYGCMGQHTVAYHKGMLGWISDDRTYESTTGTYRTITMEQLALPQTENDLAARVLINNNPYYFYTVEVRRFAGYDGYLPGQAVIIHEVDVYRDRPAQVIDIDGNGNTSDEGAMWRVGETFSDPGNGILITVESAVSSGFVVTIENQFTHLSGVEITGPVAGGVNHTYPFTATVSPIDASQPITYVWQTAGQIPVTHTGGVVDTMTFTWLEPGIQPITVTASNAGGAVLDVHSFFVQIPPAELQVAGPTVVPVQVSQTFSVAVSPVTTTVPLVYLWEVSGGHMVTHTGGLSDTAAFQWDQPGIFTITVTASNAGGEVTESYPVDVQVPLTSLEVSGSKAGAVNSTYTYTASVGPVLAAQPVTYVWQASGMVPLTHTAGLTDTANFLWTVTGPQMITVTATNPVGQLVEYYPVTIYVAPASLTIHGPTQGFVGREYSFTATTAPITTMQPITYVWSVGGGTPMTHTSGISDTITLLWEKPGRYVVTVTTLNGGGAVMGSWTVDIYFRILLPAVLR